VGLLAAIGALNWGLVGVFGIDLVEKALGMMTTPARIVYGIIGLAGAIKLISFVKCCPCKTASCETKT
jgi:uncharacterized membrane protein YuzA (DUF378 family)